MVTNSLLPIIQSLWIGNDLTQIEKLCIQSFLDHGHEFHLYTYSHIAGIPEGATVKDGNDILPENEIFQIKGGSYAAFSDWFRYAMLAKNGGFWVDMDVVCIKPFQFDADIVLSGGSDGFATAVIGMPANHPLMTALEQTCRSYKDKANANWGAMGGPVVLTQFIHKFEMEKYGKPFMYFYPWGFENWQFAFDHTFRDGINLYPNTFAVHIYNEMGRNINLDKNAQFDPDSLVEQLKKRHGIAPVKNAPTISPADLSNRIAESKIRKKSGKRRRKKLEILLLAGLISISLSVFYLVCRLYK